MEISRSCPCPPASFSFRKRLSLYLERLSIPWSHVPNQENRHVMQADQSESSLAIVMELLERLSLSSGISSSKRDIGGLPWWRSGWESACQCRGHGFEPWSGTIPHAAERLGPWATITEPACLQPVLRNRRACDGERPAHRDEEWPPLAATRESPRTETKTQHSHK